MSAPYGNTGGSSILDAALRLSGPTLNEHKRGGTSKYVEVILTPDEVEFLASLVDCEVRAAVPNRFLDHTTWDVSMIDLQCALDRASGREC